MLYPNSLAANYRLPLVLLLLVVAFVSNQISCDNRQEPAKSAPPAVSQQQAGGKPQIAQPVANGEGFKPLTATTGKPTAEPALSKPDNKTSPAVNVAPPAAPGPNKPAGPAAAAAHFAAAVTAPANTTAAGPAPNNAPPASGQESAEQAISKKLTQYLEPICKNFDKLTDEHVFKIQSQLKLFIERTAGKMSVCFMTHYLIDPNLAPVNKAQLGTICSSQTPAADVKGSFKGFQTCAAHNWDKNLDNELDRIIRLRLNCFFNHPHSKNDSTVSLVHDSEEISVIGEVVDKVFDNKSGPSVKPNITMINVDSAPAAKPPTVAPTAAPTKLPAGNPAGPLIVGATASKPTNATTVSTAAPSLSNAPAPVTSKILSDPNTLLVLVDDSPAKKAPPPHGPTPAPTTAGSANTTTPAGTSMNSAANAASPKPVVHPAEATTGVQAPASGPASPSTAAPVHASAPGPTLAPAPASAPVAGSTSAPAPPPNPASAPTHAPAPVPGASSHAPRLGPAPLNHLPGPSSSPAPVPAATSSKPTVAILAEKILTAATTTKPTTPSPATNASGTATTAAPTVVSTAKPQESPNVSTASPKATTPNPVAITTSHPSSQANATGTPATTKPPAAGTVAPKEVEDKKASETKAKKEQDEKDAKNAIKSLQIQRVGHVSDARLHQIEHERQMAIDPEGHLLKHQKYEQMKLYRTSTKPLTTPEPTKKSS